MPPSFEMALAALTSPGAEPLLHRSSAGFTDEEEYARLEAWFEEAAAAGQAALGQPFVPTSLKEPIDVEKALCWRRPNGIAYVMLWWGDNTRVRYLDLGLCRPGTLFCSDESDPPMEVDVDFFARDPR